MGNRLIGLCYAILFLTALTTACSVSSNTPVSHTNDNTEVATLTDIPPTSTSSDPVASDTPTATAVVEDVPGCAIGLGLRRETVDILLAYKDYPGFVMSANMLLADTYYPQLSGWIRTLGAPSLEELENKARRAEEENVDYEALSYGLETSITTPQDEWENLISSTGQAREIADSFEKLLVMGPGFRLMSQNEDSYPGMAEQTQIWMIQTQRLQINPPGDDYRREVERIINLIKQGNPKTQIWAQITFLPDRSPDAEEWLAYRDSIRDLVDGTFIGVYTWDSEDPEVLKENINLIFEEACKQT